jgi:polyhydroxyalkanoate synthesis regulator phasin
MCECVEKALDELVRRGVVSAKEADAVRASIMKRSKLV